MKKVLVAVAATASLPMLLSPIEAEASTGAAEPGDQPAITAEAETTESTKDLEGMAVGTKVEDDSAIMTESEPAELEDQYVVVNTTLEPGLVNQFVVTDEKELNSQPDIAGTPETIDPEGDMGAPVLDDQFITTQFTASETEWGTGLQIKSDDESVDLSDLSSTENEDKPDETTDLGSQPAVSEIDPIGSDTEPADSAGLDDNLAAADEVAPEDQPATVADSTYPTSYQDVYDAMIAYKDKVGYTEGTTWTDATNSYTWKGGAIYGANSGSGCMAFAMELSDAAFGNLTARTISSGAFSFDDIRVGDILRINGNSHSVIVLQKSDAGVIIAEANFNKSVHWGRVLTEAEVMAANYIVTRYPLNFVPSDDAEANKVEHSGTEGNLNWELTKSGTLTVSGKGAIPDFSPNDGKVPDWNSYNFNTVIIEKGVTSIGSYAFYNSSSVLRVYIADSVTSIGDSAFHGSSLMSVTIPGSVTTIGNNAFRNCSNLISATVSEGVKTIGDNAFRGCTSLTHIDFPSTITSVGAGAFMDCTKMTRVRFAPGSETVTIGDNLFTRCRALTDVTLPEKADCISFGMFLDCISLTKLYIPAGVNEIKVVGGDAPFGSCPLSVIDFGGSEADWKRIGGPTVLNNSGLANKTTVNFNVAFVNPFDDDKTTNPDGGDTGDKDSSVSNGSNNSAGTTNPKPGNSSQGTNGSQNSNGSQGNNGNQGNNGSQGDGNQNDQSGGTDAKPPGASGNQSPTVQAPATTVITTILQNAGNNAVVTTTASEGTEATRQMNGSGSRDDGSDAAAKKQGKDTTAASENGKDVAEGNSDFDSDTAVADEIAERLSELEEENGQLKDTVRNLIAAATVLGAGALGELFYFLRKIRKIKDLLP